MKKERRAKPPKQRPSLVGRYQALRGGGGFVLPASGPDIHVSALHCNGAWHQDIVRVALLPGRHGPSPEGRVLEVLERPLKEVSAHVQDLHGRILLCAAADARLPLRFSVEIPADHPTPGIGSLVLLAPQQALTEDLWQAQLLGSFGREDDIAVQEWLVKLNHQAPAAFPPEVLAEADALPASPAPADLAGRQDIRHLPLVTIDGADARDFDDAIHVAATAQGWLLRVAIADVSHYVRPGRKQRSGLDTEAMSRGNSWYFPCSVEPMLPPALSNGLCSLNPHQDRLAVLAEIPFSPDGTVGKSRFSLAVMRSAARLTYDAVKAAILDADPLAREAICQQARSAEVVPMLEEAFRLYAVLRVRRQERGSLDFDLPEPMCSFDTAGRLIRLERAQRHDAHRLIEECMIATNEAVARHLAASGQPFLYRVHPAPSPDRLEELLESLRATTSDGLTQLPAGGRKALCGKQSPATLQAILTAAAGSGQEFLVNRLCLRALHQARYQPDNDGHFGLASVAYCHFTSPIRRYADLLVHRALKASLGLETGPLPAGQKLLRLADQLNRRERAAVEAEREMGRRLGCLALRGREGERFAGIVSGVTGFGLFVELADIPVEGMIRVEDLGNDWFTLDERIHGLVGQRSGQCWRLGQKIHVRLAEVQMGRLEIRLMPLSAPTAGGQLPLPHRRGKRHKQNGRTSSWRKSATGRTGYPGFSSSDKDDRDGPQARSASRGNTPNRKASEGRRKEKRTSRRRH